MTSSPSIPPKPNNTAVTRSTIPPNQFVDRLVEAAERGVAVIVRQSSDRQKSENVGSGYFQWDQLKHLELYGIDTKGADIFDLRGETGREDKERPGFEHLLGKVRSGLYGVVIATLSDRMARNQRDTDRLVDALQQANGMLVVNGRIYDPTDPGHRLILGILAQIARHDNEMRVLRSLTSKASLAHRLELRIPLPTGLVWAAPEDPSFREALHREGLEKAVDPRVLSTHRAVARKPDQKLYVLPFPDQEVQQALKLLLEWLLETRDLGTVLDRIEKGEGGWPRPGCVPRYTSRLYKPTLVERCRRDGGLWKKIMGRKDGKDDLARGTLRDFFRSPALYGIYAFKCEGLASISRHAAQISEPVYMEGAFPALYDPEVREEVEMILAQPVDSRFRGRYDGPRNHALPVVRCASFLPDGSVCHLRKGPSYRPRARGRYRYKQPACLKRGHSSDCMDRIDELVLELVKEAYSTGPLERSLSRVRQSRSRTEEQRNRLRRERDEAEARLEAAAAKAENARTEGDRSLEQVFDRRVKEHHETLRSTKRQLQELDAEEGGADLTARERGRLLALAADVPRLLDQVRGLESADPEGNQGATRRLMKVLITQVWVRRLGEYCHDVQVEFPSGSRRSRTLISRRINVPQGVLPYAYMQLGERASSQYRNSLEREEEVHTEAAQIARKMNEAIGPRADQREWTPERVLAAALRYADEGEPALSGSHESLKTVVELSEGLGLERKSVLGAVLRGELGKAWLHNGELRVKPSDGDLHEAFPSSARVAAATKQGWPVEETVLLATLRAEQNCTWSRAKHLARKSGGIVRDAGGRCWCRRLPEGVPEPVEEVLKRQLPADRDPEDGEWMPLKDALAKFGVHRDTMKKYAVLARPGLGYLGKRSLYIWVDDELRARLQ